MRWGGRLEPVDTALLAEVGVRERGEEGADLLYHEGALAGARLDQAAGGEQPDGVADRVARRGVLIHEVSLGREPRPVHDLVCLDLAAQVISDLPVDRLGHGSPRY